MVPGQRETPRVVQLFGYYSDADDRLGDTIDPLTLWATATEAISPSNWVN